METRDGGAKGHGDMFNQWKTGYSSSFIIFIIGIPLVP
jgi:hypothetical protein